jgi:S-adenosyl-L-methionine hydrolase (adenosine-forming)
MTGLRADNRAAHVALNVAGRRVLSSRTFNTVAPGSSFCYRNSHGLAEIAINMGRADKVLGLAVGMPARVETN